MERISTNTAENVATQGATFGFACWNNVFSTFSLNTDINKPVREGSHFELLETASQARLTTKAIRVIGISASISGENCPKILFNFTFMSLILLSQGLHWSGALPQYAESLVELLGLSVLIIIL